MPARMLPESCAPAWPKAVPGQIALIAPGDPIADMAHGGSRILAKQIIFPHSNYGWLYVKNLPAGDYTLYVQFAGDKPGTGLEKITMSTYGLENCIPLVDGGCQKLANLER